MDPSHSLDTPGRVAARALPSGAADLPTAPRPLAAPAAERPGAPPQGPDWRRLLTALLRYRWLLAALTALGAGAGVVATRYVSPAYLAQANIWIDERGREQRADRGPLQSERIFDPEAWVDLLRSYVVLDSVVRELHLYLSFRTKVEPEAIAAFGVADEFRPGDYRLTVDRTGRGYELATADGISLERGAVGDSIGVRLGFRWAPSPALLAPGRTLAFAVATPRDAARHLGDELTVQIDQEGTFLKVSMEGSDPRAITRTLNAVARRYVAVAADLKRQKLTDLAKILGDQSALAHKTLDEAEQALQAFQERTATLPTAPAAPAPAANAGSGAGAGTAPADPGNAGFLTLVTQRDQLQQDRASLRRLLASTPDSELAVALQGLPSTGRFPPLADAVKDLAAKQESLRVMRVRYTDAYQPVQRLADEIATIERRTLPQLVQQLETQIDARATDAGQRIHAAAGELRAIPARGIEEARLRRNVALADNLYSTLQQRYDEAQIAEASAVPSVRVLDDAVTPQRPVKNTAPRILLLGLLGGLGLGLVTAVVLDRLDPRFRYPEQVSRDLGIPILGAVPHLPRHDATLKLEDAAAFIEALRGVRMNILSTLEGDGPLVLSISSPGPGDGKSFLTANLARVLAEGGRRTLLIDADLRRGLQHRRFGVARRPGLADYLRGEVPLSAVVHGSRYPNLDVVGCGSRMREAPELLGAPLMERAIAEARGTYGAILCDCPPLCVGVDAYVIGAATGDLVMIVRTGVSSRELAEAKLEVIGRMRIRLLGAVLNDVPEGQSIYSAYSYYLPGYDAADEPGKPLAGRPEVI